MRVSSLFNRPLFIMALLTLLAVIAYDVLPEKKWQWIPSENLTRGIYADVIHGGASEAIWVDEAKNHMRCELRPADVSFPPFCGFHVHLDSSTSPPAKDLSSYKRAHIDISYSGNNNKLRFYLNGFEPGFSDPNDPIATAKYMSVYIPVSETKAELVIGMEEFTVADWWVNNNNVPRKHSLTSLDQIVAFGVDIAYPSVLGTHELKLNSVTFVGEWISAEHWYLAILLCWIGVLLVGGIVRLVYFRRLALMEQQKHARLLRYATALKEKKKKYQELSMRDQLTGLLNRHGLSSYYENEIASAQDVWPVAILFIDIDHFKSVNDTYGHNVGDKILQRIAKAIGTSRKEDKIARWGGEEFVIVLPRTSTTDARDLAERLRQAVMILEHPEITRPLTISIGVSSICERDSFEAALGRADVAVYRAKSEGRNRVVCDKDLSTDEEA